MKKKSGKTDDTGDGVKSDDEEQSERFVEAAKELSSDTSGKKFKQALGSIKSLSVKK